MNAPYLKSSEKLSRLFPEALHKIKFHIFQNRVICSIQGLIPFKYNNTCDLCDRIQDKYKRGRITVKKCFALCKKFIDVFHEKKSFPQYKTVISS